MQLHIELDGATIANYTQLTLNSVQFDPTEMIRHVVCLKPGEPWPEELLRKPGTNELSLAQRILDIATEARNRAGVLWDASGLYGAALEEIIEACIAEIGEKHE